MNVTLFMGYIPPLRSLSPQILRNLIKHLVSYKFETPFNLPNKSVHPFEKRILSAMHVPVTVLNIEHIMITVYNCMPTWNGELY